MPVLTDDLGFLLSRASGLVVRGTNAALAADGLRVRQYSVLVLACDARGGVSQRDLARILGLDPSQIVQLVDELTASGLLERRSSPADRRTKLIVATEKGRMAREEAAGHAAAALRESLHALSAAERETLRVLLRRVVLAP
ncbi:MarR family transcriptional regulator [Amycolatopsis endophytica]|uniref:DNA-binding MarR family transcriptional regulator n=1 Tax=Amycolatopsis endophytica TaxID=860233 RepID=A0A853B9R2_9PSEU|nr:MarR family transcriptional regulator [Amycolatopsis endophytica]NYI91467.1 DNA-binding MarR family transcriptional regulator [Amycolatopsis endophytica]